MKSLQRITTEYSETEDRIRLSGELAAGEVMILWLTQRLFNHLVYHLCGWLEKQAGNALLSEVRKEMAWPISRFSCPACAVSMPRR